MLHTKFRENRPAGSGEEDFFGVFHHKWAWWPSWSCNPDFMINFRYHYPWMLLIEFHFDLPSIEENL